MKAILSILICAWSLSSCCSLFCPEEETGTTTAGGLSTTPGFNCTVSVTPASGLQPKMWVSWQMNGEESSGPPSVHRVWVGSEDDDLVIGGIRTGSVVVGGVTVAKGTTNVIEITGMTTGGPLSAVLKLDGIGTGQTVNNVTASDGSSSFGVVVRETNPPSNDLVLSVSASGGGARINLSKVPGS